MTVGARTSYLTVACSLPQCQSHLRMKFTLLAIVPFLATVLAVPVSNGENLGTCSPNGAMTCYGHGTNGFTTCANGQLIYRNCGPGTTCYPLNGGVYCDYPVIASGTTPTNGDVVGTCSPNGAMSCYGQGTNGFITCANGLNYYRPCGPGTTCKTTAGGVVYCG